MKYLENQIGGIIIKYRWLIIPLSIILVFFAGSGMRHLSFSNDSRVFFSDENPQYKAYVALENTYTKDNNVMLVIAPKDGNVFTKKTLAAIEQLTEKCWKIPYSSRVDSISNFQYTYSKDDDLIVEDLVLDAENMSKSDINKVRDIALSETLLLNRLISPSGHVTGININILKPDTKDDAPTLVSGFVRKMAADFRQENPEIDIYISGAIMIDKTFEEASKRDMSSLIPVMFVVLIIIMGFTLRSVTGTFSTVIVIIFSVICGMGLAGWTGIILTGPSSNAPVIIMTLAVADSVHILVSIILQMKRGGSKTQAIKESLRINLQPVFLTSLTTAIGFLTMNFSDAPPFRDLGNIVAMGIVAAFVFSVFFLPALMAVLPVNIKKEKIRPDHKPCDRLALFTIRHRKILLPGMFILAITATLGLSNIELDDNFTKYFDHRYEYRRHSDFLEQNLTGLHSIEYSLNAGGTNGINNPEYLKKVEEFANWYRSQPEVVHVNSITDIIKRLNKNMHNDNPDFYKIPEDRELAAQYFLLYEMSLPFGLDLNNQINVEKSSSRLIVILKDSTTKRVREMDAKARQWLRANAPESMFTYGTGLFIIFAHISERNIKSMLWASFGALVLISFVIMVALRSFSVGMISLLPNLLPAFMAFGIWGMTVSRVGLALSVLVALTLGIVVDDTVHFLSKYLRARREHGMSSTEAVRYAFNTVGTALWVTTIILAAGFTILSFSGFKVNSDMGTMTTITIVLALVLDFFLLPAILMIKKGKPNEAYTTQINNNADDNDNMAAASVGECTDS